MSYGLFGELCYFLLIIVEFLLKIVYFVSCSVISVPTLILQQVFNVTMTESSKKRKRNNSVKPNQNNQTVINRSLIDVNWQKFLSSSLMTEAKVETPAENKPDHFTGTFRRARKKKNKPHENSNSVPNTQNHPTTVQSDLKSLNINPSTNQVIPSTDAKPNNKNKITKFLALDCEMVGIGYEGNDHMLARVSIVNKFGDCIYDKFVKPREEVIDYRTTISGVRREDLLNGEEFTKVQKEVAELIRGKILVGHSLKHDLSVLFLSHPKRNIRDTSKYKPFRKITKGSTPSLKRLAKEILGIDIQSAEHSSVEDARAVMQLYCTVAKKWETTMSEKRGGRKVEES